jgi:hypothetical protein
LKFVSVLPPLMGAPQLNVLSRLSVSTRSSRLRIVTCDL